MSEENMDATSSSLNETFVKSPIASTLKPPQPTQELQNSVKDVFYDAESRDELKFTSPQPRSRQLQPCWSMGKVNTKNEPFMVNDEFITPPPQHSNNSYPPALVPWSTEKLNTEHCASFNEEQMWYFRLRNQLLAELYHHMPAMMESVCNHSSTFDATVGSQNNTPMNSTQEKVSKDMKEVNSKLSNLNKKIDGYTQQVKEWKGKVEVLNERVTAGEENIEDFMKKTNNKIKENKATEKKITQELAELEALKNDLKKIADAKEMAEICKSQEFVCGKYDELITKTKVMSEEFKTNINQQQKINENLDDVKKRLESNTKHVTHTRKYTRRDSAEFGGVPPQKDENCKKIIVNICNELGLPIDENMISTAHRLYQHPSKTTPPPIIAKFLSRDVRNSVYQLKEAAKDKESWSCYNIERLYINECLLPEVKKLLYSTKVFKREMYRIEGVIYVWTYKGEIYIRKAGEKNPRIKISCEEDLIKLRKGEISLDANENDASDEVHVNSAMLQGIENVLPASNANKMINVNHYAADRVQEITT